MDKCYTTDISKLLNPPLHSKYLQKQKDALEDLYPSVAYKKFPLGRSTVPTIPLRKLQQAFGVPTAKSISVADLMNIQENKVHQSVYSNAFTFKKSDDSIQPAGIKLEDVNTNDEKMKEIFNYSKNSTVIMPSSYAYSGARPCNEKAALTSFEHKGCIENENRTKDKTETSRRAMRDKHLVEVLWNLLKIKNHENFYDLVSAFRAYKNENDKITLLGLQKVCQTLGLSAPLHVLEKLLEECDILNKDGVLSYEEFIHCLNWKDMLPENHKFKTSKYANDWKEGINNPFKKVTDTFKTTASCIGDHKHPACSRAAGQPSNSKVDRSKSKGISEFNESGDASSMIQPNVFTKHGVFEEDLRALYTKQEIKLLLVNSGVTFTDSGFEAVWQDISNDGKASIGAVWNAMKEQCMTHHKYF